MAVWIYGVILAILGSVGDNLGNNLVSLGHKKYHDQIQGKDPNTSQTEHTELESGEEVKEPFCSWCVIGRITFVIGSFFTFAAFAFGAQSLLAALDSAQFVSNVVFVHFVHHLPVTKSMLFATLSIVCGNILVVTFAEQDAAPYTSDEMIHLYETNFAYHGYLVFAVLSWFVTSYMYTIYHDSRMKGRKLLWHHTFMEPFCYSVSSAIIGTQAVLNSKCLALLLEATMSGKKNEFAFWYLYFVLGTWIVLVVYWLVRLDNGLALFPPMFIIPVIQVFFMLFAILCGGIYFNEFVNFSWYQYLGFIGGVVCILGGVFCLAPQDMELHVPGDPDAPAPGKILDSGGTVYPDYENEGNGGAAQDLEAGKGCRDPELDKVIDNTLSVKPEAHDHPDINLFSATVAIAPNEPDRQCSPTFDASATTATAGGSARPAPSKKNRKVVRRPPGETELPPLKVDAHHKPLEAQTAGAVAQEGATPAVHNEEHPHHDPHQHPQHQHTYTVHHTVQPDAEHMIVHRRDGSVHQITEEELDDMEPGNTHMVAALHDVLQMVHDVASHIAPTAELQHSPRP